MTAELFLKRFEEKLTAILSDDNLAAICRGRAEGNPLAEGMRYAVFGGGKRIRPTAVYYGAESIEADKDEVVDALILFSCALELTHSYSLVHDDLPAMDDDDYRRGRLSVHKKFGEADGILIGDALLTEAARILLDGCALYGNKFIKSAQILATSAAAMAAGQSYDLKLDGAPASAETEYIRADALKTGALFKAAFAGGAILGGGTDEQITNVKAYAESFGMLFQLTDDILDIGKENSIVEVLGKDGTQKLIDDETEKAYTACAALPNAVPLRELIQIILRRKV